MQTTMPTIEELVLFTAAVFLGMKSEGEAALDRFRKDEPLLYLLASAQVQAFLDGPKEQLEEFCEGVERILA